MESADVRDDTAIAILVFLIILLMLALLSYAGYDRWSDLT